MAFIDVVLQRPSYGWMDENGNLVKPAGKQLFAEFCSRINIFKSRKNWIALAGWFWVLCLLPFLFLFLFTYFNWKLLFICIFYSMVVMGTHGTIWYHRYGTHRAFIFRNAFWRFITQNLVVKLIPEEIYIVSHHVHHSKSDQPGDPYNASAGFLYCFLADTNHQPIAKDLDEKNYARAAVLVKHTGIKINSYEQYQKWGSIADPGRTAALWIANWVCWYGIFYLIGGHALACALFSGALIWVIGVRTFNYNGHGKGTESHRDGLDFNRKDLSVNQYRPGLLAGEWHNNHHMYPGSARSGFLPYQIDFAWYYIYVLYKIGAVSSYHDSKKQFYENYYVPYKNASKKESVKDFVD
ncbi:acyl-CoA desaturase [Cytophaga hutchinsonii]|uniref:Fatty-acid desaturase n=1 Tax=Cytophaga hutchinsonii (strain ATCC 33406 / DSM 1761 / CIP 103989 / NBRC 15051 / NCIMB 9469 / D465) TaxID=269798 RepID=A0A6N4SPX3_CYTH3|nr:acyl-CoA desaturase [Cytophaga hutchinsonii]ABG58340.1 fatty-acid desaturase [Cytophaga hutchinsonii ATCC 33406]SFX52219.1 stearoyl-CoA desaturase (delta-9 desaturase) [Cytophaga hutchinsonii ATCC 33406]